MMACPAGLGQPTQCLPTGALHRKTSAVTGNGPGRGMGSIRPRTRNLYMSPCFRARRSVTRARTWPMLGVQLAGLPPFLGAAWASGAQSALVSACAADDGGHGVRSVCPQGRGPRVVGEGDLAGAQVVDHVLRDDRARDLDSRPGAAPSPRSRGMA